MSARDFSLMALKERTDEKNMYISAKSIENPEVPPVKGAVRGEVIIAGWKFEILGPQETKAYYLTCVKL